MDANILTEQGLKKGIKILGIILLFTSPVILTHLARGLALYKNGLILGALIGLYYILNYFIRNKAGVHNRYFIYVYLLLLVIAILVPALTGRFNSFTEPVSYLGGLITGNLAVLLLLYAGIRVGRGR